MTRHNLIQGEATFTVSVKVPESMRTALFAGENASYTIRRALEEFFQKAKNMNVPLEDLEKTRTHTQKKTMAEKDKEFVEKFKGRYEISEDEIMAATSQVYDVYDPRSRKNKLQRLMTNCVIKQIRQTTGEMMIGSRPVTFFSPGDSFDNFPQLQ